MSKNEELTIPQLTAKIRDDHGVDPPSNTKKADLVEMLDGLEKEALETTSILDATEEDESVVAEDLAPEEVEKLQVEVAPPIFSEKWPEFIMGQFEEDELDGDAPKCIGLHRLVQKFIGPIIKCGIASHTPPNAANHGTATVVFQVEVLVTNEDHPAYNIGDGTLFFEDIADVNQDNTDLPYCKHQSATAATRAESRIYRKMLNLRHVVSAEESSEVAEETGDIDWVPSEPIDADQIAVINMMCGRVNVDVTDYINSGRETYGDISQVPRKTASKMIKDLNKIQQGEKKRPVNIKEYNPNWRETNGDY